MKKKINDNAIFVNFAECPTFFLNFNVLSIIEILSNLEVSSHSIILSIFLRWKTLSPSSNLKIFAKFLFYLFAQVNMLKFFEQSFLHSVYLNLKITKTVNSTYREVSDHDPRVQFPFYRMYLCKTRYFFLAAFHFERLPFIVKSLFSITENSWY